MTTEPSATSTNINTAGYWDQVYRQEWESGSVLGGSYHRDYGPIHDAVVRLIPEGSSVLDIACGSGLLCRKIKQALPGTSILGVDFADYTIQQNKRRDADLGIGYRCVDIRNSLRSLGQEFDVVTMCEIIEHLEAPEATVAAAMELLKEGGRFILTCPHDDSIPDPEHVRCWGHDEVFHLLEPYSGTISFTHFAPPYFHIWMLAFLVKEPSEPVQPTP